MHIEQVYKLWKIKSTSSSGILKTIYHNDNYLLLFGKRQLQNKPFKNFIGIIPLTLNKPPP